MEQQTDEELAIKAREGDSVAAETLMRRYQSFVRARARNYFLAGGETADLEQEGYIGLYAAMFGYRRESGKSFKSFAYVCVTRKIVDAVKSSSRMKNIPLNGYLSLPDIDGRYFGEDVEESVIDREEQSELKIRISRALSDFEYRVLMMYMDGLKYSEICEATGRNEKSVDNALVRAKKKLQKVFGERE